MLYEEAWTKAGKKHSELSRSEREGKIKGNKTGKKKKKRERSMGKHERREKIELPPSPSSTRFPTLDSNLFCDVCITTALIASGAGLQPIKTRSGSRDSAGPRAAESRTMRHSNNRSRQTSRHSLCSALIVRRHCALSDCFCASVENLELFLSKEFFCLLSLLSSLC